MPDSFINTFPSGKCYLWPKYNLYFYGIIWGKLVKLSWIKIYHPQSYTSFNIHTYSHSYYLIYLKNTAASILVVFPSFLLDHYLWGEQAAIFEQLYREASWWEPGVSSWHQRGWKPCQKSQVDLSTSVESQVTIATY